MVDADVDDPVAHARGGARLALHELAVELRVGVVRGPVILRTSILFSGSKPSLSKSMSICRKPSTDAIIFFAPAHETSSFLRLVPLGAVMYMTAATTLSTAGGGDASDLSSVSEALFRPLSAAIALMMAGSAAARSFMHCSWKAPPPLHLDTFSSSTAAISACSSATMDSWPTARAARPSPSSWLHHHRLLGQQPASPHLLLRVVQLDQALGRRAAARCRAVPGELVLYSAISSRKDSGVVHLAPLDSRPSSDHADDSCTRPCAARRPISSLSISTSPRKWLATDIALARATRRTS